MTARKPAAVVSASMRANGVKGRKVSPWSRGPMCDTARRRKAFVRYVELGNKQEAK